MKGLLLVAMEPPAAFEDEFNDWYDTEHFPQRRGLPGFESASRWVCLSGWPRWLALYDLASPAALDTPAYAAVSGSNSTPWSLRILPKTIGRERIVCRQLDPGDALGQPPSRVARLVAARFPCQAGDDDLDPLRQRAAGLVGIEQLRLFRTLGEGAHESWIIAEYDRPHPADAFVAAFAELAGTGARAVNVYAPYRRGP